MTKNYDRDKGDKAWMPRPRNITYKPHEGDTWLFFDAETEKAEIEWLIESIDGTNALVVKQTGKDIGYRVSYPLTKMEGRRWKPLNLKGEVIYLWPCPECGGENPIPFDDYVCIECRTSPGTLDKPNVNPYTSSHEGD